MTEHLRCRAGDLAVVISADLAVNVGQIVNVIAVHDGRPFTLQAEGFAWRVKCADTSYGLLYEYPTGRRVCLKEGPVRDCDLQPIRGTQPPMEIASVIDKELGVADDR